MALAWGDLNGVRIDVIPRLRTRRWKVCRGHARESAVAHVPTASLNDLLSGPLAGRMTRGPDMGLKKAYRPGALRRTACQPHNSTTESAAMPNTMNANILSIRA